MTPRLQGESHTLEGKILREVDLTIWKIWDGGFIWDLIIIESYTFRAAMAPGSWERQLWHWSFNLFSRQKRLGIIHFQKNLKEWGKPFHTWNYHRATLPSILWSHHRKYSRPWLCGSSQEVGCVRRGFSFCVHSEMPLFMDFCITHYAISTGWNPGDSVMGRTQFCPQGANFSPSGERQEENQ